MRHIFDSHVHIFPQKIAAKASVNIGKFYDLNMEYDGSVEKVLEITEKNHVDKCLVQSVATTCAQVKRINDFISDECKKHSDKFVGFCSLHPDLEKNELEYEIERIKALGLKGIKLHPDFQKFRIDSEKAYRIYEIAEGQLPILFHTGDYRYEYSSPAQLAKVMDDFPKLVCIGAHFGGWSEWDEGARCLADKENIYVDTSSSLYSVSPEKAAEYIKSFGAEKVFFGTDYPMWDMAQEIKWVEQIPLTEKEKDMIFSENICRLLDITL